MRTRVASTRPRRAAGWLAALALASVLAPVPGRAQTCTWGGTPSLPMPSVAALRSAARLLAAPARLAVDGEGRRYVTDPPGGRLLVRDVEGRLVRVREWVIVQAFGSEAEAALVAGLLESEGTNRCASWTGASTSRPPPEDQELSTIGVAVPGERLEEAEQVLARCEAEFPNASKDAEAGLTDEGPRHVDQDAPDGEPETGR